MQSTQEILTHHWGMDETAASALTSVLQPYEEERIIQVAESIPVSDAQKRDSNRSEISDSFSRRSKKKVFVEGPCSIDELTDYEEFFDVIDYVSADHPDAVVGVRLNGIKPRTRYGWRGLGYSLLPKERQRLHDVNREAMARGFAIFNEATAGHELGEFAPYLSSFWLGALGLTSTALRSDATLFNKIPVLVKNGHDGSISMVENAVIAIGKSTEDNDGSGVNIGVIAAGPEHRGVPTGVLPVGAGNIASAIIARGYDLAEGTPPEEGRRLALEHISQMCGLAAKLDTIVLLDKTHGSPQMIGQNRKDPNRILVVNDTIYEAMENGEITDIESIGGEVAEIGTQTGRTDPNYIVRWKDRAKYSEMIGRAIAAS